MSAALQPAWSDLESESLVDLADELAAIAAARLRVARHEPQLLPRGSLLPDARTTFLLFGGGSTPVAVAQIASSTEPDAVARAVARADAIRFALTPSEAEPILAPLAIGALDGLSYGVWPWCRPLSGATGSWRERRALAAPAFAWLDAIAKRTVRPAADEQVRTRVDRPLCRLATDSRLSVRVRLAARGALVRLDRGTWRPLHVASHGDLHAGNLLLDPLQPGAAHFRVIDWGGAALDGFPMYDVVRLAHSLRLDARHFGHRVLTHAAQLGFAPADARWHLAAAFADLGASLEHFPPDRWAALADLSFELLETALAAVGGATA